MKNEKREDIQGGIILVAIGLLFLVGRFIDFGDNFGLMILPLLGIGFMVWGIVTREGGLMIPGGILSGIGAGIILQSGPVPIPAQLEDGVFMLAFGAGFASITFFTFLFARQTHWWALIPAAIMALIGLGISFGGLFLTTLELAGKFWPVILIAIGIYTIYHSMKKPELKEKFME